MEIKIKVVKSNKDEIVGWKGDVLNLKLRQNNLYYLTNFVKSNLNIKNKNIKETKYLENVYHLSLSTKYEEDLYILFQ